eukprot:759732-Hanusia_phi.AAC.5
MMLRTELSQYLDNKFTILQASRGAAGDVLSDLLLHQGLFRGWTEQYWELKYNFSDPMLIYFFSNWNNYVRRRRTGLLLMSLWQCYAGSSWKNITRDPSKSLITGAMCSLTCLLAAVVTRRVGAGGLGRKMELGKKEVWLCMRGDTCGTWVR